jgi:choline-sulfatase
LKHQPNIILFVTDDHAPWTLPCYGNTEVHAPTFDRLAREGTVFRNVFSPTPVCSPGRACLLTGLTSSQHGVHDWIALQDPVCQERDWLKGSITLAELLKENGYCCGLSGKWHIGQDYMAPRGYDWHFGYVRQNGHEGTTVFVLDGRAHVREGNVTQVFTEKAVDFIHTAPDDKPFFLHVGYTDTHSPWAGQDPELVDTYKNATFRDIRMDEPHPWRWNEFFDEDEEITSEKARACHMHQYAGVSDIDRHIEHILNAVEKSGKMDNTIILYTSDHGLSLGQNGFWGKGNGTRPLNMYEVSIRVPLIMRGPGIAAGIEVDRCVDHFDTFQTICGLAGVRPEAQQSEMPYPGRNFLPLALGNEIEDWDDTKYGEYGDLRMIRTPRHKLVRRFGRGPDELFNLVDDLEENHNAISEPDNATVVDKLSKQLEIFFDRHSVPEKSGLIADQLPRHNIVQKPTQSFSAEGWRDGIRELRGFG